jgi:hypothetical protein
MDETIKITNYIQSPLFDKKVNAKSWMTTMRIADYLAMAQLKDNPYQRELQNLSFYKKLIIDLLNDGVMPPISVVYNGSINDNFELNKKNKFKIVDGLQRTNCLIAILSKFDLLSDTNSSTIKTAEEFLNKEIYVEIWEDIDLKSILYKMVVLNTGQKKMDYSHQLDILSESLEDILKQHNIEYLTTIAKNQHIDRKEKFLLSDITTSLVSYINRAPISGKKNAAEFLFNKLNIEDNIEKDMQLIDDDETYKHLVWILKIFSDKLDIKYTKVANPLKKYDVFLVSFMAALGHVTQKAKYNEDIRNTLNEKMKFLENEIENSDILKMDEYIKYASTFTSGIGDKRKKLIYETFIDFFLMTTARASYLEWGNVYGRYFDKR